MATTKCSCAGHGKPAENGFDGIGSSRPLVWCPTCAAVDPKARNIVLFSDGTGNSSGKLFKTNVWRMYEAVDLGPTSDDAIRQQIAYYDDGVGTSSLKPLALLGGVFGQGLKRNVLDIYKFACRSYEPGAGQKKGILTADKGDLIYGFGFSRGAFTMRLAIALIADQGLVPYQDEPQLDRQARAAYRSFRSNVTLRYRWSPMTLFRGAWRWLGRFWQATGYDKNNNWHPVIRFVGLWDTVAAYGGPITEVTRAIDNWIHPLSMPNYALNPAVQRARHALALDDERDSFRPLLWDEIAEQNIISENSKLLPWVDDRRLEQVWFAGMHADVGGGYPDESLSFVSLLWMVEEAHAAGLRTVDIIIARYRALASSLGPMHDSRSGLGSYYRYQPRRIESWLNAGSRPRLRTGTGKARPSSTAAARTASMRDPAIEDDQGRTRGLLNEVKVHESVIARIVGRKDYAPFVLPPAFRIVPPGREGEAKPQATSGADGGAALPKEGIKDEVAEGKTTAPPAISVIDPDVRERLDAKAIALLGRSLEPVWDRVWLRRGTYFGTLTVTLLLVGMPVWIDRAPNFFFMTEGRNWLTGPIQALGAILPNFLSPLIETYSLNTSWFISCFVAIVALRSIGKRLEGSLRKLTRSAWNIAIGAAQSVASGKLLATADPGSAEAPKPSAGGKSKNGAFGWIRNCPSYQRAIQVGRWHVLPNIVAVIMLLLIAWFLLILCTQFVLPVYERGTRLCPPAGSDVAARDSVAVDFSAQKRCNPLGLEVRRNETYRVSFRVSDPWKMGISLPWVPHSHQTTPEGLKAGEFGVAGRLTAPLRRVAQSPYLRPILLIRPSARNGSLKNVYIHPLTLRQDVQDPTLYSGDFSVERAGVAYLFGNGVVVPLVERIFKITGTACVTVRRASYDGSRGIAVSTPTCRAVASVASDREKKRRKVVESGGEKLLFD